MAVKKCCVENCKSCSTRKEDKGVTYHKFPKDTTSRNEWQHITHYKNVHKDLAAYVCSRHFCKGDFQKNKDSKYILKSDAVPSIFPWTVELKMDKSLTEETLSSIVNEDERNQSTSSKGSETENVDAIKKFIEDQEKEIQDRENKRPVTEDKKEDNVGEQNVQLPDTNIFGVKEETLNEISSQQSNEVVSSVMDMIINEADLKVVPESSPTDSSKERNSSSNNDHKFMSPDKGNTSVPLSVGCKVEVKDYGDVWFPAEIAEVDYDEMEVLVRYEIDFKKQDEWINVSSLRLRQFTGTVTKPPDTEAKDVVEPPKEKPPKEKEKLKEKTSILKEKLLAPKEIKEEIVEDTLKVEDKPKLVFEVGERCLARWRDNRRFVATIQKDLGDGKFEIIFDDGFVWTCGISRLHKMKTELLSVDTSFHVATAGSPSPMEGPGPSTAPMSPLPAFHTHLFDPARDYLCSKSERREKKRKLNIKEIFNIGQKKYKIQKTDDQTPKTPVQRKPRILKRNTGKKPKVVLKKEIKSEIPDAVASIIGTVNKEVEIKLEPINTLSFNQTSKVDADNETNIKEEMGDEMGVDNMEPMSCVVNPNDKTLDDEDTEEPKSEEDPVLEEEVKLENFEKQDVQKHEEVIDKIKEAIIKLEGGISDVENGSPKVERVSTPHTPLAEVERKVMVAKPEVITEVKQEDLKDVLAEVAASIDMSDSNNSVSPQVNLQPMVKAKRDPTKMKKGRKLRLLQEKKVKRQVEKVKSELEQMKRQFEEMRKQLLVQTQEFAKEQSKEITSLPESFLYEGQWACKWVNGQPVGKVSEIEAAIPGPDDKPGLPRRSVEVEDKRLPPGWTKHMVRRSVGNSAGKWDVVLVSPEELGNKRFHTKTEVRNFFEHHPDEIFKSYEHALTDFGVHLKVSRRMGWISVTPDGITEAPETILSAGTTDNQSPLVKRKKFNLKKRIIMKDKKRAIREKTRRPIKLKLQRGLHTYNSQIVGESSIDFPTQSEEIYEQPPIEDGYVYVGSLKVQINDTLLRCPAEGCLKNFRTKTLLQMHIKHYHRDLTKMMGATPKVLDLAYARRRPGFKEKPHKKVIKVKINKPMRREEPKMSPETDFMYDDLPKTPTDSDDGPPTIPRIPRSLDSPKLRQALIHKPVKRPRVLLPVRKSEAEQALPDGIKEEDFDPQVTEPLINVPLIDHPLDFETAISTHTVTKPTGKKKKGDKKKSFALFSKNVSEDEEWFAMNSDELDTRSSFPRSVSPDSKMDFKLAAMSSESNDDQKDANYTYTETGERVKIVHMKREEIINCHCGFREEDGLMVQCELCLCWQHALCHNIQRECEVPEKYTCSICLNPRRGRRSKRFLHDQDRMYEGLLPGAKPCESLRRSHELAGNLVRIDDALHALRVKYYVATKKDHPKLYLWATDWEQAELTYTQEKLNSEYSDLSVMINGMDKENLPVKEDDAVVAAPTDDDPHSADRLSHRDNQLGPQSLLSGLLSSPGGGSLDLPISTSELERLAKSVQESAEWRAPAVAPQPEAAIDNEVCRARLLRHIQRCQAAIDTRLDSIEAQVAELESQDPSFGEHYETADFYPRTKQTVQMLMRDLDTMEELGVIT